MLLFSVRVQRKLWSELKEKEKAQFHRFHATGESWQRSLPEEGFGKKGFPEPAWDAADGLRGRAKTQPAALYVSNTVPVTLLQSLAHTHTALKTRQQPCATVRGHRDRRGGTR